MASAILLISVLMFSSVRVGKSAGDLFTLKCQSAVGVIGQTTHISCSIEAKHEAVIKIVALTRTGEEKACFTFQPIKNFVTGDSRFKVNLASLQLHNTKVSDEGEYKYLIRTSLGSNTAKFTISVTANYSNPIITSVPNKAEDNEPVDLSCSASGGYPAGTIHWFIQSNKNWTKSATLQITQGNDGLFTLTSKLSFQSFDTSWAPFRCVVLNNKYEEEGSSYLVANDKREQREDSPVHNNQNTNVIAGVVVIGSLIVGLLVALLFKRRRNMQLRRASACPMLSDVPQEVGYVEENEGLNDPVYKNAADGGENITV